MFNRPKEVQELLNSLTIQTYRHFEVIIIEDGSNQKCIAEVDPFLKNLDLHYYYKHNTGPGNSRNYGASKAIGDYLVFFDSDCIIPADYLTIVNDYLSSKWLDSYGGPDRAHRDFSNVQKAINYSMTSILTTGGIRGHQKTANTFQPRSFNMGVSRAAFDAVGGFSNLHPGEDPDLIYRLVDLGFTKGLLANAYVYHKRRVDFKKFGLQVYKFGVARAILMKWHPASMKWIFAAPSFVLVLGLLIALLSLLIPLLGYLLLVGFLLILFDCLRSTGNIIIAILGVIATIVQIAAYGWGFIKGWWQIHLRKKQEHHQFPEMFMGSIMKIQ